MSPHEIIEKLVSKGIDEGFDTPEELSDPAFRECVYKELYAAPLGPRERPLLLNMMHLEIEDRRKNRIGDYFENLYWCAFLLFRIGDLRDINILWLAKNINMDTGAGMDIQYFVGAGVSQTLEYLRSRNDKPSQEILEYLLECESAGDFEGLDEWIEWRMGYFSESDD